MKKKPGETCETKFVHEDRVRSARKALRNERIVLDLCETFSVLSDPTRLNIVQALSKEQLCVCDIAALLGMTDSAISHQLRLLRNLRLVKYLKKGKMAYYSVDDEHINRLIEIATRHVSER